MEIVEDIVMQRLSGNSARDDILKDIFITGGYSLFKGFEQRFQADLRAILPADIQLGVRRAKDPFVSMFNLVHT